MTHYFDTNWWLEKLKVQLFSFTVRAIYSDAPRGSRAAILSVTVTSAPSWPARWAITSSAIRLASLPARASSRRTVPKNRLGKAGGLAPSPDVDPGPGYPWQVPVPCGAGAVVPRAAASGSNCFLASPGSTISMVLSADKSIPCPGRRPRYRFAVSP